MSEWNPKLMMTDEKARMPDIHLLILWKCKESAPWNELRLSWKFAKKKKYFFPHQKQHTVSKEWQEWPPTSQLPASGEWSVCGLPPDLPPRPGPLRGADSGRGMQLAVVCSFAGGDFWVESRLVSGSVPGHGGKMLLCAVCALFFFTWDPNLGLKKLAWKRSYG